MKGTPLEAALRAKRDKGHKLLVTYVTGGVRGDWAQLLLAMADGGADAIEVGLPFSDPMMDGPTVQEASRQALERGDHQFRAGRVAPPRRARAAGGHDECAGRVGDANFTNRHHTRFS